MSNIKLSFPAINGKYSVLIETDGLKASSSYPIELQVLNGRHKKVRYDQIIKGQDCVEALAEFDVNGIRMAFADTWKDTDKGVGFTRKVKCLEAYEGAAVRWTTNFGCIADGAESFDDYQIIVPGSVYNKNDTDRDGKDDYLGTFNQDYKDDRNPSLSVTVYAPKASKCFALIRADLPVRDRTITHDQINARHFIHDTDIGSLGFAPSECDTGEFVLRCDYPFYERSSFCLNVDGSGWAAYKAIEAGTEFESSYIFFADKADTLTDAAWAVQKYQNDRILNPEVPLPFTLEEARDARLKMLFNSYREFPSVPGTPAGFCVHFSPRKHYGKYNIIEYGFCGAQAMVSHVILKEFYKNNDEEYYNRAVKTLDFFVKRAISPDGIPEGIYDADKDAFVYWWTGILFPFQYASDRESLVNYVGDQIVDSLMDVAEALKDIKGNYTRSMCETIYYLLLSYKMEKERGREHPQWLAAIDKFCNKLLEMQDKRGFWYRGYSITGEPLTKPEAWFGASVTEHGSGTIFPVEVLVEYYRMTGEQKFFDAARRGAEFIQREYVNDVTYLGGLNDTTHIKSVKIDAIGVMYAMRSMLMVYEVNHDPKLLLGARDAARILATWTYVWDIPFDETTLLGANGFKTTGWTGCDVIPACSYVDDEFPEFVPDLLRVATYCKDKDLANLARIVTRGMHHGLSMPQRMYGYAMPGVQCEGYMTSLWLSDTTAKEFSGAAAKNKGDDNDTCNGLINAQAVENLNFIYETYGTFDFDEIIKQIMG